ncbi:MAG: hypothetical protein WC809_02655 [Sinimarinibacterium sp.]|jgi:hypothetical protein
MSGPERRAPDAHPDDGLLDTYLAGQSELSRAYRKTAAPQPPAEMDRRILDMARSEMQSAAPVRAVPRRGSRWRTPLAAAAVVVLSFGVLINLQRENVLPTGIPETSAQRQRQDSPRPAAPAEQQTPTADTLEEDQAIERKQAESAPAPVLAPPPVQVAPEAPRQNLKSEAELRPRAEREPRSELPPPAALAKPQGSAADAAASAISSEAQSPCAATEQRWAEIRRLLDEQRSELARNAYRDFRSVCPGVTVPDDLRTRLEP